MVSARQAAPEGSTPDEEDYFVTPSGPLGSRLTISQGSWAEEIRGQDCMASRVIRERMEREQFWPDVWYVDDHGGMQPYVLAEAS